jgi:hypothetical protein
MKKQLQKTKLLLKITSPVIDLDGSNENFNFSIEIPLELKNELDKMMYFEYCQKENEVYTAEYDKIFSWTMAEREKTTEQSPLYEAIDEAIDERRTNWYIPLADQLKFAESMALEFVESDPILTEHIEDLSAIINQAYYHYNARYLDFYTVAEAYEKHFD